MRSLDPCSACPSGTMLTQTTRPRPDGLAVVRYLRCNLCGAHGKSYLPPKRAKVLESSTLVDKQDLQPAALR